jgi:hypothetical protein
MRVVAVPSALHRGAAQGFGEPSPDAASGAFVELQEGLCLDFCCQNSSC